MQAGLAKENTNYVFKNSETTNESGEDVIEKNSKNYKGYFKIGSPYQVFGVSYFPQNYEDYEEIGTASWYGDDFHGKPAFVHGLYKAAHGLLDLRSLAPYGDLLRYSQRERA